ncbi:MAG: glutamine amidotransferase, partial [Deltaproteobacteria bacterium]
SMGTDTTRWDAAVGMIRDAQRMAGDRSHARVNLFRFGQKLSAIEPAQIQLDLPDAKAKETAKGARAAAEKPLPPAGPTDSDSQLAGALRQLSSRFGRALPASIVLFSDGQARDAADVEKTAGYFSRLKVPIHVVPVGDTGRGGDVAIVGVLAPDRARRFSQVDVQALVRSFGYEGRRVRLVLSALGDGGQPQREITSLPITLHKGAQMVPLTFQTDTQMRKLAFTIEPQEDEISTANNRFTTEIGIDRTKIRVLYIEGNVTRLQPVLQGTQTVWRGSFSDLQEALSEDPDIECVVLYSLPGSTNVQRLPIAGGAVGARGFPDTVAELSAFDCIILSSISRDAFTDKQLQWIENWVRVRGGGLCMAGGQFSFASGGWEGSLIEPMLPVVLRPGNEDFDAGEIPIQPVLSDSPHAIWQIVANDRQNREIVRSFPRLNAANRIPRARPDVTTVLATSLSSRGESLPLITAGMYHKGRTLAFAGGITEPWSGEFTRWGQNDHRYYAKFWRNTVYWLTEKSSIGRRRLIAVSDKKFYRPGETISLSALAYDEGANPTRDYTVDAMIEPAATSAELTGEYSPVRWPDGMQRTSGEEGPLIAWGEEFTLAKAPGKEGYEIQLPITEILSAGAATQALRIELTAREDQTQVDSTSLNLQVLDDPFELQNPFPNHELLSRIAAVSGGRVLTDPESLAKELTGLPVKVGPPERHLTPLWTRWELLALLVGLLTAEWVWRRSIGLA